MLAHAGEGAESGPRRIRRLTPFPRSRMRIDWSAMEEFEENRSWLSRRLEDAFKSALMRAYETVRINPHQYLIHLRMAHGVPAVSYDGMFSLPVGELDSIARQ